MSMLLFFPTAISQTLAVYGKINTNIILNVGYLLFPVAMYILDTAEYFPPSEEFKDPKDVAKLRCVIFCSNVIQIIFCSANFITIFDKLIAAEKDANRMKSMFIANVSHGMRYSMIPDTKWTIFSKQKRYKKW
jgi:hypothetical protein